MRSGSRTLGICVELCTNSIIATCEISVKAESLIQKHTSSKSNEGIDRLLEAAVCLSSGCGLQGDKVGEVRTLQVLDGTPQPVDDLGQPGPLGFVYDGAVQHPHLPASTAQQM